MGGGAQVGIVVARSQGAAAFTPLSLSPVLWLDASQITGLSDGAAITTWTDASGNGNNITQSTAAAKPTYKTAILNGKPVARFDGGDRLINASISVAQPITAFVVASVSASDSDAATFFDSYNNVQCIMYRGAALDNPNKIVIRSGPTATWGVDADNNANILTGIWSGASSSLWKNGGTAATGSNGTNGLSGVSIGNIRGNPNPLIANYSLIGDIAEIIIYSGAMSDGNRQSVQSYLSAKYGIAVS